MAARDPVIVGIGLSDYPVAPHLSTVQHHAQAMQRALADCGLPKGAIDGYCSAGMGGVGAEAVSLAEYLGIDHRYIDSTMTGGSSFEFHVQHAAAALRQGLCETVLVTYGSNFLSARGRTLGTGGFGARGARVQGADMFQAPYGLSLVGAYAMVARRHMHEFGTKPEQLAEIAAGVREYRRPQPAGDVPRPDHRAGRAREPHDRRPAAHARLLRRLGRRRRVRHDHGRARARPAPARRARARRRRRPDALEHLADAGLHALRRREERARDLRAGRASRPPMST